MPLLQEDEDAWRTATTGTRGFMRGMGMRHDGWAELVNDEERGGLPDPDDDALLAVIGANKKAVHSGCGIEGKTAAPRGRPLTQADDTKWVSRRLAPTR